MKNFRIKINLIEWDLIPVKLITNRREHKYTFLCFEITYTKLGK